MQTISKIVIPVAGLGTRLMPATKEQPKEMLPLFARGEDGILCLKPIVQRIFEQLYDFGMREFYFVVGRGKRAIEDHFTPDRDCIRLFDSQGKRGYALDLERFYSRIETSLMAWINQPEPKGFGHAVLETQNVVGEFPFLVHAGDTYIISRETPLISRMLMAYEDQKSDVTIVLQQMEDPRQYGVAEVQEHGSVFEVKRVIEKPDEPSSKLAIMPIYIFNPVIFDALRSTLPGKGGEIQLTDAIQRIIDSGRHVSAIVLTESDVRLDIGTPENYWEALELSHRTALQEV